MMCTDCIWVQEGMDEVSKTPPNSPSAHSSPNLVKFDKFKSFGDKMIQELTRPNSTSSNSSHSEKKLSKPKPFVSLLDRMVQELTTPEPSADTTCGVESTPFSKRIQKD